MEAKMKLAGFTDEAATGLIEQVTATKALGWSAIELRGIDGKNVETLTEKEIRTTKELLEKQGIEVCALGSTIANWGESVNDSFSDTIKKVEKDIYIGLLLGTKLVRIMSYAVLLGPDGRLLPDQQEKERFRRLREICKRFLDVGIVPVHENCHTYGGMSWEHSLRLLDEVPGMKLVFDTGNPPLIPDFRKSYPYPVQNSWEFYSHVREHIAHIHIKDSRMGESKEELYTYPGEGDGCVFEIVSDLLRTGYKGYLSIEPHMAVVFHDTSVQSSDKIRFDTYVNYGNRFTELLDRAVKGTEI
jgi:sugar phosphate isomerase/epimerase